MPEILIVVATPLEALRLPTLPHSRIIVSGIGAVNAALSTQAALLEQRADLVLSVGIAGAYPNSGLELTNVIVSSALVYAGFGVQNGSRVEALGFPIAPDIFQVLPVWNKALDYARVARLEYGVITTLETVTTNNARAKAIEQQFSARAEAMEGAGVAQAALRFDLPCLELRSISNLVGDRKNWQLQAALGTLAQTLETTWDELLNLLK
ncbi:MAG: futalosine hydrolase [Deinococcota bacterium]|jgi:futalosine hydrolase